MSSGQPHQAREALGVRLRDIRKDAGLTGRALAAAAGWHPAKITKIEHGRQTPSEDDLRAWCRHCDASDQLPELVAIVRHIEAAYVEWRRQFRGGMRRRQELSTRLYEQTTLFRTYQPILLPALFQTADYAAALMRASRDFFEIPDDVEDAVAARLERQRILYHGDRRFMVVLEEQVLRTRIGSADTMAGQLDRLLTLMGMQRVSLGVMPSAGHRLVWPSEGFVIFDDTMVRVETVSAQLTITQPREIALYTKTFDRLVTAAAYGAPARRLLEQELHRLRAI